MFPRPFFPAAALAALSCASETPDRRSTPELRAIAFLSREVRAWPAKNKCFSCHNNGEGARALFAARRLSVPFDPRSVEETTRYLARPEEWRYNGPEGVFSDKKLAAIQFASALAAAVEAGAADRNPSLARARSPPSRPGRSLRGPGGIDSRTPSTGLT
jgi:hypothetical protein